jgi:hypothetical protein
VTGKIFDHTISSLGHTRQTIDPVAVERAIVAIREARSLHFYGMGASSTIAFDALRSNQIDVYVEYTGTIDDACYTPFVHTQGPVSLRPEESGRPAMRAMVAPMITNGVLTLPAGYRVADLYDLQGRKVWSYRRASAVHTESIKVPEQFASMVLRARLTP